MGSGIVNEFTNSEDDTAEMAITTAIELLNENLVVLTMVLLPEKINTM